MLLPGKKVAKLLLSRVLRQGDPLSLYLFIIETDMFSISVNANMGKIIGIKLAKGCLVLTHFFFFANDSLFFSRDDEMNARKMKSMLDAYCEAFGQLG